MNFVELCFDKCPHCKGVATLQDWLPEAGYSRRLCKFICRDCKDVYYKHIPEVLSKDNIKILSDIANSLKIDEKEKIMSLRYSGLSDFEEFLAEAVG